MTAARFIVADVFDGLAALKAEGTQVDLVLTSPPFLALRSYLPPDHPDKGKEIGSEPTPAAFLATMLDVVEACADVLAPHGSICFEFGDTYAGSGGAGGDYADDGLRAGQETFRANRGGRTTTSADLAGKGSKVGGHHMGGRGWPQDKSLCMIPELFAASLAYGRNLLDPDRTTDPWRIRNTVAWVRPNPPVGALGDKVRPAKSLLTWAAKARDRWFDLDAVRTAHARDYSGEDPTKQGSREFDRNGAVKEHSRQVVANPAGAPPLDWWKISPGGYSGSHYAVFPPELCRIPIEASCPRRVCRTCGTPSRREVGEVEYLPSATNRGGILKRDGERVAGMVNQWVGDGAEASVVRTAPTTGWTSCGCSGTDGIRIDGYHTGTGWRPGVVLDPFAGSGTTLMAATGLSRDAIGLDLDERNADLARERIGMFVTVEHLAAEGAA